MIENVQVERCSYVVDINGKVRFIYVVVGRRKAYLSASAPVVGVYERGTYQYRRLLAWCLEPTQSQPAYRHIERNPPTARKRWKRSVEAATDPRIPG